MKKIKRISLIMLSTIFLGTTGCGKQVNEREFVNEYEEDDIEPDEEINESKQTFDDYNQDMPEKGIDNTLDIDSSDIAEIEEEASERGKSAKDYLTDKMITIIDFIFYDKNIGGLTFKEVSEGTKQNIIDTFYMIDDTLEYYYPGYKDSLNEKYSKGIDEIKRLYGKTEEKVDSNLTDEDREKIENAKEKATEYGTVAKEKATDIYDQGKVKVKTWYENYRANQNNE